MKKTDNDGKVYVNKNGDTVLRVSEVIGTLSKKQLVAWANKLGLQGISHKDELRRTANIGSLVHNVLEQFQNKDDIAIIDYDLYDVTSKKDKRETKNALRSFRKWYNKLEDKINVVFTEYVVVGEEVGGTIDCAIEGIKDPNKLIFIDYKTSSGVYLTMMLQLAGYVKIYEENYGSNTIEGIMVIQLDKKNGNRANAKFISRKKLDPYIYCFNCLLDTTIMMKTLQGSFGEDMETIH